MKREIYGLIFTLGLILLAFLKYYEAPVNFTKAADTKSNITATINATREQPETSLHPVEKPPTSNTFCELPENFRLNFDNFKVQFLKKKATLWLLEGERREDVANILASFVGYSAALEWYYSTIDISIYATNIGLLIEELENSKFEADALSHSVSFDSLLSDFKVSMRDIFSPKSGTDFNRTIVEYLRMYPDIKDSIFLYATMAAMESKSSEDVIKFISGVTRNDWNANIWPRMIDLWGLHSAPEMEIDEIISHLSQIGTIYFPFQYDSPFSRLQISSSIFSDYKQEFSLKSEEVDKSEFSNSSSSLKDTLEKDYPLLFMETKVSCDSHVKNASEEAGLKIEDEGELPKPVTKNDYPELNSLCPSNKGDYMETIILAKDFRHKNGLENVNFNDIESLDYVDWQSINAYISSLRKSERNNLISYVFSNVYPDNPQQGSIYKVFFDKGFFVKEADAEFLSVIMRSKSALELIDLMKFGSYIEENSGIGLPIISLLSDNSHLALQLIEKGYPISRDDSSLLAGFVAIESIGSRKLEGHELDSRIEVMNRIFSRRTLISDLHINSMANLKRRNPDVFSKIHESFPELFPYEPRETFEFKCE